MAKIAPEKLLAEIEGIIRAMPTGDAIYAVTPETLAWLGCASAAIRLWDPISAVLFINDTEKIHSRDPYAAPAAIRAVTRTLHQAAHELRLQTVGPVSVAIGQGGVFDYFDEVRKVIETARSDLFFVDPYLDAEFVSRYLPHVANGVPVRLLGRERIPTLLPAVKLLQQQNGLTIEVRSAAGFHDRYVFVDRQSCYQSGASFKDGAKKSPTTLTQITDAFAAVLDTYEVAWNSGTVC
jgi:hypothetical protein